MRFKDCEIGKIYHTTYKSNSSGKQADYVFKCVGKNGQAISGVYLTKNEKRTWQRDTAVKGMNNIVTEVTKETHPEYFL